jgi:hypothetical protein
LTGEGRAGTPHPHMIRVAAAHYFFAFFGFFAPKSTGGRIHA